MGTESTVERQETVAILRRAIQEIHHSSNADVDQIAEDVRREIAQAKLTAFQESTGLPF